MTLDGTNVDLLPIRISSTDFKEISIKFQGNAFENVCKLTATLLKPQCVNNHTTGPNLSLLQSLNTQSPPIITHLQPVKRKRSAVEPCTAVPAHCLPSTGLTHPAEYRTRQI